MFIVHVVCIAPPPPDINIVGTLVKSGDVVIVKLVDKLVVIFAVMCIAPPPFQPITGMLVYPAPPLVNVIVLITPAACVHVAVAVVVGAPPP